MATMGRPPKPEGTTGKRYTTRFTPDLRAKLEAMATGTRRPMAQVLAVAIDLAYDVYLREGKL